MATINGSFFGAGKNEYYWRLLSALSPDTYITDKTTLPYTPDNWLTYTIFLPQYASTPPDPETILYLYIDGLLINSAKVAYTTGFTYFPSVAIPKSNFNLQLRTSAGSVVINEYYNGKNYALFPYVAAQSYEDRLVELQKIQVNSSFSTMQSSAVPDLIGNFFDFPIPAGWTSSEYRETILGGPNSPGFVKSFLNATTYKGVVDTIKSVTRQDPVISPVLGGYRWVIFDSAQAYPYGSNPNAWFIADNSSPITLPNHRIVLTTTEYINNTVHVTVVGSTRTIPSTPSGPKEGVIKRTDSFVEAKNPGLYAQLPNTTLTFWIRNVSDPTKDLSYYTKFSPTTTTAAQAAFDILTQNPSLQVTSAVDPNNTIYAYNNKLRIGVSPIAGVTQQIQIYSGTSIPVFGWTSGQTAEVSTDVLANTYALDPPGISLTYVGIIYTQGVDFTYLPTTGEIVWKGSCIFYPNIPPAGATYEAAYTYQMRREVQRAIEQVKESPLSIEYEWA